MFKPSIETAREIAASGNYQITPLYTRMHADWLTPIQVMKILKSESRHCYMLESVENNVEWGRYTFMGFDPVMEITCVNGVISGTDETSPDQYLRKLMEQYKSPVFEDLPEFTGGLVGYFSYDYIKYGEPSLNLDANDQEHFKDLDLMLFDQVIVFDHIRQSILLIVNIALDDLENNYQQGIDRLNQLKALLHKPVPNDYEKGKVTSEFRPLFEQQEYCSMVERAKRYIYEGDIFQVVLSNRFEADFEGSLFDVYRKLRILNPSPYMFYFSGCDVEFAGASPETLVKLEGDTLYTFPLAGTRPRGINAEQDEQLKEELLADEKELSEHHMLVDLGRNDLGKISQFGTVKVEKYLNVEKFSHVMHLGSTVTGTILADKDGLDAVAAVLPAGTLSGAPKIRACEIINELENNKRGLYGGAIGYLSFTGNLDTCIAIRLAFQKNGKVFVRSGAGIVADSVPQKEYEECLHKAQAVMNALTDQNEEV